MGAGVGDGVGPGNSSAVGLGVLSTNTSNWMYAFSTTLSFMLRKPPSTRSFVPAGRLMASEVKGTNPVSMSPTLKLSPDTVATMQLPDTPSNKMPSSNTMTSAKYSSSAALGRMKGWSNITTTRCASAGISMSIFHAPDISSMLSSSTLPSSIFKKLLPPYRTMLPSA